MARDILACCAVLLIWVLALYGLYGLALLARGKLRRRRLRRQLLARGRLGFEKAGLWLKN